MFKLRYYTNSNIYTKRILQTDRKHIPVILHPQDTIVPVTLSNIYSSDLYILHGAVPMAKSGISVGLEIVGVVEAVGTEMNNSLKIWKMFG